MVQDFALKSYRKYLFVYFNCSKQSASWKVLEIFEHYALSTDSQKTYSVNTLVAVATVSTEGSADGEKTQKRPRRFSSFYCFQLERKSKRCTTLPWSSLIFHRKPRSIDIVRRSLIQPNVPGTQRWVRVFCRFRGKQLQKPRYFARIDLTCIVRLCTINCHTKNILWYCR